TLWVAKWTMRYWLNSWLVAVARLALKSIALILSPAGATDTMDSASSLEKGRREIVLVLSDNPASLIALVMVEEAGGGCAVRCWFALRWTRGSCSSKTGSASTAIILSAGFRPSISLRNVASTEADGRLTIS